MNQSPTSPSPHTPPHPLSSTSSSSSTSTSSSLSPSSSSPSKSSSSSPSKSSKSPTRTNGTHKMSDANGAHITHHDEVNDLDQVHANGGVKGGQAHDERAGRAAAGAAAAADVRDEDDLLSSSSTEDEEDEDERPVPSDNSPCNLIVKYLPDSVGEMRLRELFSPFGELAVARVIMDRGTGRSRGYGFVKFYEEEHAATAVQEMNGYEVDAKTLRVSVANPYQHGSRRQQVNLYVAGIPAHYSSTDLSALFSPFGNIMHARVLYDRASNLSRGVGFVRFESQEQGQAAIQGLHGSLAPGGETALTVRFARPRTHGRRNNGHRNNRKNRNNGHSSGRSGNNHQHHASAHYYYGHGAAHNGAHNGAAHHHMHMQRYYDPRDGYQAYGASQYYSQYGEYPAGAQHGHQHAHAHAHPHAHQLPHPGHQAYYAAHAGGEAYMYPQAVAPNGVEAHPDASAALNGHVPPADAPEAGVDVQRSNGQFDADDGDNTGLFVFHIPPHVDESYLQQLFSSYGIVINATVVKDHNTNASKGFGFVYMQTPAEARAAIAGLDGYPIGGKYLSVSFKRKKGDKGGSRSSRGGGGGGSGDSNGASDSHNNSD